MTLKPPRARRHIERTRHHGILREDAYAWLKAHNWEKITEAPEKLAPGIRAHLEAENAYTEAMLAPSRALRKRLAREMRGRIPPEDRELGHRDGAFVYYRRVIKKGEHPVFCRQKPRGPEARLLDANVEAAGTKFFKMGDVAHAPDHAHLAWSADRTGGEHYTLHIRDTATRRDLDTRIESTTGESVWADARTLFYVELNEQHRPSRVWRHTLGETRDHLVYEERDSGFFVHVSKTLGGRYIVITAHDHTASEQRLIPAHTPRARPRLVAKRRKGVEYELAHDAARKRFFVLTNAGGAQDFKIMTAPEDKPGQWRALVAHKPGVYRLAFVAYRNHLIWLERANATPRAIIRDHRTGARHEVAFPDDAYDLRMEPGYIYETSHTRLVYASMRTPARHYDYDMATRRRVLRKAQKVPGGHKPGAYITQRLFATAADGARIPVSLLYARAHPPSPKTPLLLYGYGAYGITIPAGFSSTRLSLVNRGWAYAIAHVRGGAARGYGWYLAGRADQKTNTFTDFIAVADDLVRRGMTRKGAIVAHGGSAGGLLMGAVANMRPDLFRAILAEVPFVDVLATMLDADLPLTPPEWPEWGNPIKSAAAYRRIAAYSPYDNVRQQAYPHILATGGLTDPRVCYWEPAKWVARLRAVQKPGGVALLKTHMGAGHGGASGRFARLDEVALAYAFALHAHKMGGKPFKT